MGGVFGALAGRLRLNPLRRKLQSLRTLSRLHDIGLASCLNRKRLLPIQILLKLWWQQVIYLMGRVVVGIVPLVFAV